MQLIQKKKTVGHHSLKINKQGKRGEGGRGGVNKLWSEKNRKINKRPPFRLLDT